MYLIQATWQYSFSIEFHEINLSMIQCNQALGREEANYPEAYRKTSTLTHFKHEVHYKILH